MTEVLDEGGVIDKAARDPRLFFRNVALSVNQILGATAPGSRVENPPDRL